MNDFNLKGFIKCTTITLIFLGLTQAAFSDKPLKNYLWLSAAKTPTNEQNTIESRFLPPKGFTRISLEKGSFGAWLRSLPLFPGTPPVMLYNGEKKGNQTAHVAVLNVDTGKRDNQHCADAIMRLRGEYLLSAQRDKQICFKFTNGSKASWRKWASGYRPKVSGSKVTWVQNRRASSSYKTFRQYMNKVFQYGGTASLSRETKTVDGSNLITPGDLFVEGGYPGHAVIVVDVATDKNGNRAFLLAQSYMPAQQIHILKNPANKKTSPWYIYNPKAFLATPEWNFAPGTLKRFTPNGCGL